MGRASGLGFSSQSRQQGLAPQAHSVSSLLSLVTTDSMATVVLDVTEERSVTRGSRGTAL